MSLSASRKKKIAQKQKIHFNWCTAVAQEVPGHNCAGALAPSPPAEFIGEGNKSLSSPRHQQCPAGDRT